MTFSLMRFTPSYTEQGPSPSSSMRKQFDNCLLLSNRCRFNFTRTAIMIRQTIVQPLNRWYRINLTLIALNTDSSGRLLANIPRNARTHFADNPQLHSALLSNWNWPSPEFSEISWRIFSREMTVHLEWRYPDIRDGSEVWQWETIHTRSKTKRILPRMTRNIRVDRTFTQRCSSISLIQAES